MNGLKNRSESHASRSQRLAALANKGNEIRMALIFLGLILLPSALLGYLSWRALENEKVYSRERLRESYRQFGELAARKIDDELAAFEKIWVSSLNHIVDRNQHNLLNEDLDSLALQEPLIASIFLLTAPGRVIYPANLRLPAKSLEAEPWENEAFVREYEIFNELRSRGEELEYDIYDLESAIATYRNIQDKVHYPQLIATAQSLIGRAQMKKGDFETALGTFRDLLTRFPEIRDLNKMYMRFLAQLQIAECLERLHRDQEAIATLLDLNQDLLDRSDGIHNDQYEFFLDQIQQMQPRLLSSSQITAAEAIKDKFQALLDRGKKRRSQNYFLQLLDRRLTMMVIERQPHRDIFRYVSDQGEEEPYLLAYRSLPDPNGTYTNGLTGIQIDLECLGSRLFPSILKSLKVSDDVSLGIMSEAGDFIIGAELPNQDPIAVQSLHAPFEFWQIAIYESGNAAFRPGLNLRTTYGLWIICVLFLSILFGTFFFVRRARQEAHISQLKSTFVSNVSHELRTPLASITMLAELLEMQLDNRTPISNSSGSPSKRYLSVIRRECGRLGRLIENILDFTKVERGVKVYHFEYEDPGAVVSMAVDAFRPHAEANDFDLQLEIPGKLPELKMDADAISQAVLNLLSNAVKYSTEERMIRVKVYDQDGKLFIQVCDRGIGISSNEFSRIFSEFYRVDERLNAQGQAGVGLGLTLVKHIVQAHGGEIKVVSEVGKGSVFTLELPLSHPDSDQSTEAGSRNKDLIISHGEN